MFITFMLISLIVVGLLTFSGKLAKFGQVPGDIHYRGERIKVFAPITFTLLLSLLLSIVLTMISWLF